MAVISGTNSSETVTGTSAGETLLGLNGDDSLLGLDGDDALVGGNGNDSLTGGNGNDLFVFDARGFGTDRIADLNAGDRIDLRAFNIGSIAQLAPYMSQVGSDVHINFQWAGGTERIVVAARQVADITAASLLLNTDTDPLIVAGTSSHDTLFGGTGNDALSGNGGDDSLNGGGGSDALNGGTGNDLLRGGAGNDRFVYSARGFGSDVIADFAAGDRIDLRGLNVADFAQIAPFARQIGADVEILLNWAGGTERILIANTALAAINGSSFLFNTSLEALRVTGTSSHDTLFGGNGNDTITGSAGDDTLSGAGGADVLTGGTGDDVLRGGTGNDRFLFDARGFGSDTIVDFTAGDRIDLRALNIADLTQLAPFMSQIGNDVRITLDWAGGTEVITISNVTLANVNAGYFLFNGSASELLVEGTSSHDTLFGGNANDMLSGFGGNDSLVGGSGDDALNGGTGNDVLRGGAGSDRFVYSARGFGIDTIADFTAGDRIDLRAMNVSDLAQLTPFMSQVGADVQISFAWAGGTERIVLANTTLASINGASFQFNTSAVALVIDGTSSHDALFGAAGSDQLYGYGGNDSLSGGAGSDALEGGTGNDALRGGAGNDRFVFAERGFGIDTIVDFAVGDRIDLRGVNVSDLTQLTPFMSQVGADVQINLQWAGGTERIVLAGKQIANVNAASFLFNTDAEPQLVEGSSSHDTLFGGVGADQLYGFSGNDTMNGGTGDDVLIGGTGLDTLRGGAGADRFVYQAGDGGSGSIDRILDFSSAQGDKIDLRRIDPFAEAGDQALGFVSGAFTGVGQARIAAVPTGFQVQVNLDANLSTVELAIDVVGAAPITVTDLLL